MTATLTVQSAQKPPRGRKYTVTMVWMAINSLVMVGSGYLAMNGKLTSAWVTLSSSFFVASAGVISVYNGSNAYLGGKTAGLPEK